MRVHMRACVRACVRVSRSAHARTVSVPRAARVPGIDAARVMAEPVGGRADDDVDSLLPGQHDAHPHQPGAPARTCKRTHNSTRTHTHARKHSTRAHLTAHARTPIRRLWCPSRSSLPCGAGGGRPAGVCRGAVDGGREGRHDGHLPPLRRDVQGEGT